VIIRDGRDADAADFIRLIRDAWSEYPGCVFDLDGELPELRALASDFARRDGALWAAEVDGLVQGMVACRPLGSDEAFEICKMYVDHNQRGTGLAHALLERAEAWAARQGAQRLVLWTDTRFEAAHRFYEKRSYVRSGSIRILDDLSKSLEFRYAKPLASLAVEALDAAAAASAERRLAEILVACVDAGASVSFLPPLAPDRARAFWRQVASDVALGAKLLLVAWADGVMVGTVHLQLAMPENQPHRADVAKLLVHPAARRRGVGRALMQRAEQAALRVGRSLLVLDTWAEDSGAPLYRSLGWHEAGRIPGYALQADRTLGDTLFFWKQLP
jgi:GNAT superfamily N-acetyltransferase